MILAVAARPVYRFLAGSDWPQSIFAPFGGVVPPSPVAALIRNLLRGAPPSNGDRAKIAQTIAGAPFNTLSLTAQEWIDQDPSGALKPIINTPMPCPPPPGQGPELIRPNTILESDLWHAAKHRFLGDFVPQTMLHEYLGDLRNAGARAAQVGQVFVGNDPKGGGGVRAGLLVKLGANGAPCRFVAYQPGMSMFISYLPQQHCVITGFPVRFPTVQRGYPFWDNRIEVLT
jgi:hypothetical protein